MNGTLIRPVLWAVAGLALGATEGAGFAPKVPTSRSVLRQESLQRQRPDSVDVLADARSAQARFERRRRSSLPWTRGESGYPCDNRVGRFCQWFDGGVTRERIADPPEVVQLREELLNELSEASVLIPGDRWILGQRVFYLAEAGRWDEAAGVAERCGPVRSWWCEVLLGFALHGGGDYGRASSSFYRGLAAMDSAEAGKWLLPEALLDGRALTLLKEGEGEALAALRQRFWLLADPLYLMPGNDRETEHFARWTYSYMSDGASNPRGLGWGRDLEELTVRYGWDRGWERRRPRAGSMSGEVSTVGHDLPGTREFVPSGLVLERPWGSSPTDWFPGDRPRSAYLAPYAPTFDAGVGQVAVFHRGDAIVVVAATRLPEPADSARMASDAIVRPRGQPVIVPWAQPEFLDEPDQVGLFLLDRDNGLRGARLEGASDGVLSLSAAAGDYLMSLEAWAPAEGRAGRVRNGIATDTVPRDLATLSDLVVLRATDERPEDLEQALPLVLSSLEIGAEQAIGVGWEIFGLGWRPEHVGFELSLSRDGQGILRTLGRWLGVGGGEDEPVQIGWSESGPEKPGGWFRSVNVDIPDIESGEYLLRLEVSIPGRELLVATRTLEISH